MALYFYSLLSDKIWLFLARECGAGFLLPKQMEGLLLLEAFKVHVYQATASAYQVQGGM